MDCLFCKIASGEVPANTIYEDELVKVFMDIHPDSNGHLLIIPKKHYLDLNDIDPNLITHIHEVSIKMNALLRKQLKIDGLSIIQNNGTTQVVKHYHTHLVPRYLNHPAILPINDIYKIIKAE